MQSAAFLYDICMALSLHTVSKYFFFSLKVFCATNNAFVLYLLMYVLLVAELSACHVLSSSFLSFSNLCSSSFSPFMRPCIKRGGLAICAVGGSCVSVLFCSIIGWGGKWKALCSRSPLFLSSCVLTFSLYLSLSLSPSRTTH